MAPTTLVELSSTNPGLPAFIRQLAVDRSVIICDRSSLHPSAVYRPVYDALLECMLCDAWSDTPEARMYFQLFQTFPQPSEVERLAASDDLDADITASNILDGLCDFATDFFMEFCWAHFYTSPYDPTVVLLSLDAPED